MTHDPHDDHHANDGWTAAADGLALYAGGLAWRLGIVTVACLTLGAAIYSRSPMLVKLVGWGLPIGTVITGLVMLIGLFGFASQPANSPGKAPSVLGAAGMAAGFVLDLFAFVTQIGVLTADKGNYRAAEEATKKAESAARMGSWALVLGGCALVAVLGAMWLVARRLRRPDVAGRVLGAGVLVAMGAAVVVWFRSSPLVPNNLGQMVLFVSVVLIIVIAAGSYYIDVVRDLEAVLRDEDAKPDRELARAQVVSESP